MYIRTRPVDFMDLSIKTRLKKREMEYDHLEQLPDELLLHIFDKVRDAKCLKRCLAVSKTFKSLVPLTATLSISIDRALAVDLVVKSNPNDPEDNLWFKGADAVFTVIPQGTKLPISYPFNFHIRAERFRNCTVKAQLKGFKNIQSLRVNLINDPADWDDHDKTLGVCNCMIELGGATQLIRSCIMVDVADSYHSFPRTKGESMEEGSMIPDRENSIEKVTLAYKKIVLFLMEVASIHSLLRQIVIRNPTLRDVVVADACRNVKLHAGENEIADMRMRAGGNRMFALIRYLCVKVWLAPVLRLPESGCVLSGVTFVVMMNRDLLASRTVDDYGKFLKSYLDGDVGMQEDQDDKDRVSLIREAVLEMSKKHGTLPCNLEKDIH